MKDNEIRGVGNTLDFKYRGYDARLARFYAVDPLTSEYPWYTPYQFAGNTPIWARELEGLEPWFPRNYILKDLGPWGNDDQAARAWGKKVVVPAAKHIAKEVAKAGVAIVLGHPETSLFADALLGRLAGEAPVAEEALAARSARSAAANEAKTVVSTQRVKTFPQAEEYIEVGLRSPELNYYSGAYKANATGQPNSVYTQLAKNGKAVQNTIYDIDGNAMYQVDFKIERTGGKVYPSGHGHVFEKHGDFRSGHNGQHIPHTLVPSKYQKLPAGVEPSIPIGNHTN